MENMDEYVQDAEFKCKDPRQVHKNDDSLWRVITIPEKIEFFLLKRNQLQFFVNRSMNLHHSQQRQYNTNLTGIPRLKKQKKS